MRTHREIIEDAGGWRKVRNLLGMPTDDFKPKFWHFRDSIPAEYWRGVVKLELTTLEELADAAARRQYLKERAPPPKGKPGRPRKQDVAA